VEGEKDAETLWQWGLIATTSPMGANKTWRDSYTEALAGAHCRIIPDQDPPGIRWANTTSSVVLILNRYRWFGELDCNIVVLAGYLGKYKWGVKYG